MMLKHHKTQQQSLRKRVRWSIIALKFYFAKRFIIKSYLKVVIAIILMQLKKLNFPPQIETNSKVSLHCFALTSSRLFSLGRGSVSFEKAASWVQNRDGNGVIKCDNMTFY
uniref:(northern house mosquito) hypothetical protein n=1 Tax=Culex pipiens TaxID=7175 RepID=A0A8D8MJE3_CULPI